MFCGTLFLNSDHKFCTGSSKKYVTYMYIFCVGNKYMCQVFRRDNADNQLIAEFAFFPKEFLGVSYMCTVPD